MNRLLVAPIVEGHGEYDAVRILLDRVWREILGGDCIEVLRPIREKRNRLAVNRNGALTRAVELAARLLAAEKELLDWPALVFVLLDADDDLPCVLGPELLRLARDARDDVNVSCVVANVEFETWFVAAAESLSEFIDLREGEVVPNAPEVLRCGKGWIKQRFRKMPYSETLDQPKLTARFDMGQCRTRSPSFDKLCRDLQRFITDPHLPCDEESHPS